MIKKTLAILAICAMFYWMGIMMQYKTVEPEKIEKETTIYLEERAN